MERIPSGLKKSGGLRKCRKRRRRDKSTPSEVTSLFFTICDYGDKDEKHMHMYKLDLLNNNHHHRTELFLRSQYRQQYTLVSLNSVIFCLGGFASSINHVGIPVGSTDVLSVDTSSSSSTNNNRSWSVQPPMNLPRLTPKALVLRGKIFVIGGFGESPQVRNSKYWAEVFDPGRNCWSNLSVATDNDDDDDHDHGLSLYTSISPPDHPVVSSLTIAPFSAHQILILAVFNRYQARTFLFDVDHRSLIVKDRLVPYHFWHRHFHPVDRVVRVGHSIYHLDWFTRQIYAYNVETSQYLHIYRQDGGKSFVSEEEFSDSQMSRDTALFLRLDDGLNLSSLDKHDQLHFLWIADSGVPLAAASTSMSVYYKRIEVFQKGDRLDIRDATTSCFNINGTRLCRRLYDGCCLVGS